MPSIAASPYRRTGSRSALRDTGTSSYAELLEKVRAAGLLARARGFYWRVFAVLSTLTAAAAVGIVLLGDSWLQLIIAGALGVLFTQFAFLSHEAAHSQVFASRRWNTRAAQWIGTLVVGMSYSWWQNKHTRHHGNPNTVGKDPDIAQDTVSFLEEDAAARRGPLRLLTLVQGWAFLPLLTLEGINLHWLSIRALVTGRDLKGTGGDRALELTLLAVRFGLYVTAIFLLLPFGMAWAFLGVQLAVFGIMMGGSFVPNHTGMPIIAPTARIDFFARQVRTSRNIRGGRLMDFAMGGLNRQTEHHLFPSMARPHLRRARRFVIEHAAERGVPYTETTLLDAFRIVVRHLNRVGLAARDPFACPLVAQYRIH